MTDLWQARERAEGCPFCLITHGESDADVVWEDEDTVAFLDRRPVFPGHVLVAPRRHLPTLADVPPEAIGPLFGLITTLSEAVPRALGADGAFVAVNVRVSQSVPHLHVHVVPRRRHDGLRGFFWPRTPYASDDERERVRAAIAAEMRDGAGEDGDPPAV